MTRLYVEAAIAPGAEVELDTEAAHHARTVLRLSAGDRIVLFDGRGGEYEAELVFVARAGVRARVGARAEVERESPLDLTLVQCVSRGERMDYTVQKAVELGVNRIVPVTSRRTVVRLDPARAAKRRQHWAGVVRHAAEQSGRTRVPELAEVTTFDAWLARPGAGRRLLLDPRSELSLATAAQGARAMTLIAGPEGGFEPGEIEAAVAAGAEPVRLGPRTLRTETAAIAALAVLQALAGDLR